MEDKTFTFVALKYGCTSISSKAVFYGDTADTMLDISMMFYLVEYAGRRILIDTGSGDIDSFQRNGFSFKHFCRPVQLLESYGLAPADINDIILTHSHFDHLGDTECYPNATIYISSARNIRQHGHLGRLTQT